VVPRWYKKLRQTVPAAWPCPATAAGFVGTARDRQRPGNGNGNGNRGRGTRYAAFNVIELETEQV
jgi:hypothetical protein